LQIIPATPEKVSSFISAMGDSAKHFRYFSKRPVSVISQHLVTLIGELPAGNPVAYGHLDPEGGRVWLGICVAAKYRSLGFGKQMITALLQAAGNCGVKVVHLAVDCDNIPAIEFYEKIGFEPEDTQTTHHTYRYEIQP